MSICPDCWREHDGPCDTRSIEDRKADADREAAKKAAKRIEKERGK